MKDLAERRYHVVVIRERDGAKGYMTATFTKPHQTTPNHGYTMTPCPRFLRTDRGCASEVLTLVQITSGNLVGKNFTCAGIATPYLAEYPYLVQVTTGPETGDDFVGLYDLDGGQIDPGNSSWEIVTEAPSEVIDQIERGWESGTSVVSRLG